MAPTLEAILGNGIVGEVLRVNKEVTDFSKKYLDMSVSDDDLIKEYQDIFYSMAALGETSIEEARSTISPRFIEMVTAPAELAIRKYRGAVRGSPSVSATANAMKELAEAYEDLTGNINIFIGKAYKEAAEQLEMKPEELASKIELHLNLINDLDDSTPEAPA